MIEWRPKFHQVLLENNIKKDCCYDANQTGIFYKKLPSRLYVDAYEKQDYEGVKNTKEKKRVTIMLCTTYSGSKFPLSIIVKTNTLLVFLWTQTEHLQWNTSIIIIHGLIKILPCGG